MDCVGRCEDHAADRMGDTGRAAITEEKAAQVYAKMNRCRDLERGSEWCPAAASSGVGHLDINKCWHHDACMRTTLTLDDDVAAKLKNYARRQRVSFKEAVNTVLRRGFTAPVARRAEAPAFRVDVFNSPFRPGVDPLRLNQLCDDLEAEEAAVRMRR